MAKAASFAIAFLCIVCSKKFIKKYVAESLSFFRQSFHSSAVQSCQSYKTDILLLLHCAEVVLFQAPDKVQAGDCKKQMMLIGLNKSTALNDQLY